MQQLVWYGPWRSSRRLLTPSVILLTISKNYINQEQYTDMMASKFPIVDVAPIFDSQSNSQQRQEAASALTDACHRYGFVAITGHNVSPKHLRKAFDTLKTLFALPREDKMKAPHPAGAVPHRGYSAPGREKVSMKERAKDSTTEVRKIADFKVSAPIFFFAVRISAINRRLKRGWRKLGCVCWCHSAFT